MTMFNNVMMCMLMLHNGQQVDEIVHKWHLDLVCSRISSSYILRWEHNHLLLLSLIVSSTCLLNCKTLILSIPMCYTKCHNVNNVSLRKVIDVDE